MKICLAIAQTPRRWHEWLASDLLQHGHAHVHLLRTEADNIMPSCLSAILALERIVYGIAQESALDAVSIGESALGRLAPASPSDEPYDVLIALDGPCDSSPRARRVLSPMFDAAFGIGGAVAAISDERPLRVGVWEKTDGQSRAVTYLAEKEPSAIFLKTLNSACVRAVDLIVLRVGEAPLPMLSAQIESGLPDARAAHSGSARAVAFSLYALGQRLRRRVTTLAAGGDRWAIGWRGRHGNCVDVASRRTTSHRYTLLKDDRRRFFADPFPVSRAGHSYIFCEELPYATGRGHISVLEIGRDGVPGPILPVLEEPYHLSYPMIFDDGGALWMIPESGESGTVVLYRCEEFPTKWRREAVLLTGITAYDPTIHRDSRGYWLFATTAARRHSPSDRLCLFHARDLAGPWHPAGSAPALVDPSTARPAGHLLRAHGKLYRPAQDCSEIYGGAVVFCEVTRFGEGVLEQIPAGRLAPADCKRLRGAHTYTASDLIETVDVFGAPVGDSFDLSFRPLPDSQLARASLDCAETLDGGASATAEGAAP